MIIAGVDIGSTTTKVVLINEHNQILSSALIPTGFNRNQSGDEAIRIALKELNKSIDDLTFIASTGYGRRSLEASQKVMPEIICHAKGTYFLYPDVKTIIDIGGQDSKVIALNGKGRVDRFEMNDKCAAGTGRFLDVLTSRILNISLDELGPLAMESTNPSTLSSICTIFAESEIISLLSTGTPTKDIAAGMHIAIVKRIINMGAAGQISFEEPIIFSGGVARNIHVAKTIENILNKKVIAIEKPQMTAALGVALAAKEELQTA